MIEAHEARVPLLVLTADRPPELRDLGAGQTIDQVKLYGSAAKWYLEVDEHPATPERMRWMRQLACRAFWTALDGRPGPVHLNFALREPLVLEEPLPEEEPGGGGRDGGRPWLTRPWVRAEAGPRSIDAIAADLMARPRAVLVAGRNERDPQLGPALASFAESAAIPLLAEPLSGARRGQAAVAHYDALLREPAWAEAHKPDLVLRVGDLPTSKPLRQWLHALPDAIQIAFDPEHAWQDPAGFVSMIVGADPRLTLATVGERLPPRRDRVWLDGWLAADGAAARVIGAMLDPRVLSEPLVAAELGARLPPNATLVVASSMPVRDVETFFPTREDAPRVLANRGANGIDGTVSTAFGAAAAAPHGPAVLLIGRRRARARRRRAAGGDPPGPEAHDRGDRQRRRRHLRLPPGQHPRRGLRAARRDPARARLRARRGALRLRVRARRRPRGLPGRAGPRAGGRPHHDRLGPHRPRGERAAAPGDLGRGGGVRPEPRLASGSRWRSPRPH